ncbi:hypothetical protein CVT24_012343 [Panaeolus cyanescens]|uniref:Mannosyltransferase n=1 Tax=Panaeolus cyanescens TaxID=181874 RepID=A0A409W6A7_9AGAR|nr:hypothetical protein CVT24_012343 [Panaeolus cyanescens]
MSTALDLLIFATAWTHVILAPYTKVEESFNLHATHDALMYGVGAKNLFKYDHFVFPGAVPRTFIGSTLLAWLASPVIKLAASQGLLVTKFQLQILIRLVLASLNAWTLCRIRRAVDTRFGRLTGFFFTLLTCSQFHFPFWMGRTIPNMFAMIPVNLATHLLVSRTPRSTIIPEKRVQWSIFLLAFSAAVFRAEIAAFLAPFCLQMLVSKQISLANLLKTGVLASVISAGKASLVLRFWLQPELNSSSLACTTLVDSYFWDKFPLWPEFSSVFFNVIEGKSAEWGVSPRHVYYTSYLPKLLLSALPLSIIGFLVDQRFRELFLPSVAFISLISNLGHKEWRFIVYVVPIFNIAAARGCRFLASRRKSTIVGRLMFLIPIGGLLVNVLFTFLSTKASCANYPGGEALTRFHGIYSKDTPVHVHISNLAAQTGASLFLQLNAPPTHPSLPASFANPWVYNKTEGLTIQDLSSTTSKTPFTHLIAEVDPSSDAILRKHWQTVETIKGFDRWAINRDLLKRRDPVDLLTNLPRVLQFVESDKLWILERKK